MTHPILSLFVAVTALISTGSAASYAQTATPAIEQYTIDKPHTQIMFKINHLGLTYSYGKFLDYDGTINLDRATPEKSSVTATIKTASLDLGDAKWNEHLKSPDFFNVEKFPTMTFKSTGVTKTGDNTANVSGDLTLLGVTKPVMLKVTYNKSGPNPIDGKQFNAAFTATGMLKRSEFGMGKYVPMVGDDVTLMIEVQGNQVGYQGAAKGKE